MVARALAQFSDVIIGYFAPRLVRFSPSPDDFYRCLPRDFRPRFMASIEALRFKSKSLPILAFNEESLLCECWLLFLFRNFSAICLLRSDIITARRCLCSSEARL